MENFLPFKIIINIKNLIERNVDLKTWKGWMFLFLALIGGFVIGALLALLWLKSS